MATGGKDIGCSWPKCLNNRTKVAPKNDEIRGVYRQQAPGAAQVDTLPPQDKKNMATGGNSTGCSWPKCLTTKVAPEKDEICGRMEKHYRVNAKPSEDIVGLIKSDQSQQKKESEKPSKFPDDIAANLYVRAYHLALGEDEKRERTKRYKMAEEREKKALDLLEKQCQDDEEMSTKLILESFESSEELDCITLAVKTKCGKFLGLRFAHNVISEIWNGDIKSQPSSAWFWIKLHLAVVFPPMLYSLEYKDKQGGGASCKTENQKAEPVENGKSESNELNTKGICDCRAELQKIRRFYSAPTIAFRLHMLFYIIFLMLYSYMVLVEFSEKLQWSEILIYVWLSTMVVGEFHEVYVRKQSMSATASYMSSVWNVLDVLCPLIFFVGVSVRHSPCPACVDVGRVIYAIDLIIFYARILQILTVNKLLGLKLVMIKSMFKDLFGFLIILSTIVFGYSVATEAILYPNTQLTPKLPLYLTRKAYFQIFGELFLDDIAGSDTCTNNATLYRDFEVPRCPSYIGTLVVPVLLGAYILLTNVLLLNLLIAMFSFTFNKIQQDETEYWNLERARLVLEFKLLPAFPPPLNVLCILYDFLYKECCQSDCKNMTTLQTRCLECSDSGSSDTEEENPRSPDENKTCPAMQATPPASISQFGSTSRKDDVQKEPEESVPSSRQTSGHPGIQLLQKEVADVKSKLVQLLKAFDDLDVSFRGLKEESKSVELQSAPDGTSSSVA